ncbi:hypothetical protein DYB35_012454 [Aphanomyces astaci]|uniref:Uncharacterized protein n=1 Tax=Aphanomyces astaci TaxID=112090 RepID=A0A418DWN0_APHAT|nr:hypothetical protein DYB35_012454 [Aphanomyces astaci]
MLETVILCFTFIFHPSSMSAQRLFKTELNELQATMEHMCFEAFFHKVRYLRQRMMDAQGSITKANAFVLDVENWIFMQNVIEEYYTKHGTK